MGTGKVVLEGRRLTHSFGKADVATVALSDVSLTCAEGEMVLIMGPSGSGKSTLLAVLSGLLRPDHGEVIALGQKIWALPHFARKAFRLRHCGFIFQGFNLFPALTARAQLEIVLRWGEKVSGRLARRRAEEMLSLLGLGNKAHLRPNQLSGGEKQRVAIGRALIKSPVFCFADEITSALDWGHGQQVIELLRDAARQRSSTVLIVSHEPRILPYADRTLYLEDGRLVTTPTAGRT